MRFLTRLIVLFAATAVLVGGASAQSAPTLNSKWHSKYDSAGGPKIDAMVTLMKSGQDQLGSGKYETQFGNGTFTQVRKQIENRQQTPPIPSTGPLPGPNSPNNGATPNDAVYIKGLWHFAGKTGWFKWELYETPQNECKFLGKWGYVENGQAGPTSGKWNGSLRTGNQNGSPPQKNVPLIAIP